MNVRNVIFENWGKTHLALIGLILLGFAALGFVLGWTMLGLPHQRINLNRVVVDIPMQILHTPYRFTQSEDTEFSQPSGKTARASVPVDFFDFNNIKRSEIAAHTFEIVNDGNGDLLITSGSSTCPCVLAEVSSSRIPPKKSALVTIFLDPALAASGTDVRRGIILETNDPQNPKIELWVQAAIIQ